MINNLNKEQLLYRGWTPENLRERIKGCRKGIKEITNKNTKYTYRYLFVSLYLKYRYWLKLIEN